jgi:cobalamin biosynthesis protein CbiD
MNRICINKKTGKLIGMQSGGWTENKKLADARLNTLKQNALNAGYAEKDIEIKWATPEETEAAKPKVEPDQTEVLIRQEMRDMAIERLKAKGKLPPNYSKNPTSSHS